VAAVRIFEHLDFIDDHRHDFVPSQAVLEKPGKLKQERRSIFFLSFEGDLQVLENRLEQPFEIKR
jgi:hypothetical protein